MQFFSKMPQKRTQANCNMQPLNPMPQIENQDTENTSVSTEESGAKFDNTSAEPNQSDDSTSTSLIVDSFSSEANSHQTVQDPQSDTQQDPTNVDDINSEIAKHQKKSEYLATLQQLKDL